MASKRRPRTRPKTDALSELLSLQSYTGQPDTVERRRYASAVGWARFNEMGEEEREGWCVKTYGRTFGEIRADVGRWADEWDERMAAFNARLQAWDARWGGNDG